MRKLLFILALAGSLYGQAFNPTASIGSACTGNLTPNSGCNGATPVLTTDAGNTNAQTQTVSIAPANFSTLSLTNYLYTGATTRKLMHWMPWFKNTAGFNSHLNIGMNENTPAAVAQQLAMMKTMAVDTMVGDYYGPRSAQAFNLGSIDAAATLIAASPALYPNLMLILDQGSWNSTAGDEAGAHQCKTDAAGGTITTAQMEVCIEDQLDYMANKYLYQTYYEKEGTNPIVGFFLDKNSWGSVNWSTVYSHAHAHVAAGQSCANGGLYPGCVYTTAVLLIDRNSSSFGEAGLDGAYGWSPTQAYVNGSSGTQLQWDGTANYLNDFYTTARANPSKIAIGLIYHGFDNTPTSFGSPKIVAQQCAQVLNFTSARIGSNGYSSSSQLKRVQFETWNDYEEGTSLEVGTDNCYSVTASAVGTNVSVVLNKLDATFANIATIHHLRVLYCTSTTNCLVAQDNLSTATTSFDLFGVVPAGTYTVYWQAVGMPMVKNQLSNGLTVLVPAPFSTGIIASKRAVDWSGAGVIGGIPSGSWANCVTTACNTLNSGTVTSASINAAYVSAPSQTVVRIPAGNFSLTSGLTVSRSNVAVRGAGAASTLLTFTGSAGCSGLLSVWCISGSNSGWGGSLGINPDNTATWTAGYTQGATSVTLSSVTNLAIGKQITLDQCNGGLSGVNCTGTEADTGQVYTCNITGANCTSNDGPAGGQRTGRAQQQIVTVTNIVGNVVSITPALYMPNWASGRSPGAFWATSPNTKVGIENMSITFTGAGTQADVTLWNCYQCWVSGVRSVFATHTENGTQRNHIWLVLSAHATIRDNYLYGSTSLHSEGYGIESFSSSDSLMENNIMQNMPSPQMMNGSCTACVISYNYSINDANDAAFLFNSLTIHAPVDYLLAEGNIGNSYRADKFHGSHNFGTAFRNYYNGWETGITNGLIPYFDDGIARYFNAVGNVLGKTGIQPVYACTPSSCPGGFAIYELGTSLPDALTATSQMRWGNYDTQTATTRFQSSEVPSTFNDSSGSPSLYVNPVPGSTTLSASFVYSATPSWWPSGKAWPPIGPDVTGGNVTGVGGHVFTIPAQDCANTIGIPADGSGTVKNFDASTCYATVSGPSTTTKGVVTFSGGVRIK